MYRRRTHYQRLASDIGILSGARPLVPKLPDSVVPQVFPLLVDAPEIVFPRLKQEGVPIIRFGEFLWPGVDASVCPVSADLSRRLLQFPVHQSLRTNELNWMISRIRLALTEIHGGRDYHA